MIAYPSKLNSILPFFEYSETLILLDAYKKYPLEVDKMFASSPWFFVSTNDLSELESSNESFLLSESARRWNKIKLEINKKFFKKYAHSIVNFTNSDWDYFIHFNSNQGQREKLWTNAYPASYDGDAYWIEENMRWIFKDYKISKIFSQDPHTIERLLIFDKNLFFDEENLEKLIQCNPNFKISETALLWNDEKLDCWKERRESEFQDSKTDWENNKAAKEFQDEMINSTVAEDNINENYFNATTDGQMGSFDDFDGNSDDIDTWSRG